jgi:prophage antirepressor-like protein
MNNKITTSSPSLFHFYKKPVRTITDDNFNIWWVAKDVCEVLELSDARKSVQGLDDDERKRIPVIDSLGRKQETFAINESGLYTLILRSNKPQAKEFKRWITHEVLPSLRKTGAYDLQIPRRKSTPYSIKELQNIQRIFSLHLKIAKDFGFRGSKAIEFSISRTKGLIDIDLLDLFDINIYEIEKCAEEAEEREYLQLEG